MTHLPAQVFSTPAWTLEVDQTKQFTGLTDATRRQCRSTLRRRSTRQGDGRRCCAGLQQPTIINGVRDRAAGDPRQPRDRRARYELPAVHRRQTMSSSVAPLATTSSSPAIGDDTRLRRCAATTGSTAAHGNDDDLRWRRRRHHLRMAAATTCMRRRRRQRRHHQAGNSTAAWTSAT